MAVKELISSKASLEVESKMDTDGNISYSKKSLPGNVKPSATADQVLAYAQAFKGILEKDSRFAHVVDSSEVYF